MRLIETRLRPDGADLCIGELDVECSSDEWNALNELTDRYHPELDVFGLRLTSAHVPGRATVWVQCPSSRADQVRQILLERLHGLAVTH